MEPPENSSATAQSKQIIRAKIRAQRATLADTVLPTSQPNGPGPQRDPLSRWVQVLLDLLDNSGSPIAAYLPMPREPDCTEFIQYLLGQGHQVLAPILKPNRDLDWAWATTKITHDRSPELREPSPPTLGVAAISQAQLVLVPALAVDRRGTRLGQGGGSYDRALARVGPSARVIALLHPGELLDALPAQAHDRPVDAALTTDGILTWTQH